MPIQALRVIPFMPLSKLTTHEKQFFSWMPPHVVHPAHVPFHRKTQTAYVRRARDQRPRCRLFSNSQRSRLLGVNCLIEFTQEIYCLQMFSTTVLVRSPFTGFT